MFTGARVYDVVAIVTIVLMAVVITVAVDAIYGAAIVGVNGWDCSKSGAKLESKHNTLHKDDNTRQQLNMLITNLTMLTFFLF